MMNSTPRSPLFYVSISLVIIMMTACSTTEPTPVRGKLPERETTAPRYKTDEQILIEIEQLKANIAKRPGDTDLLLKLAGLQVEVKNLDDAIITLEKLKTANYTAEPKMYATLGQLYSEREEYAKAKENYLLFKERVTANGKLVARTDIIIEDLDFKMQLMSNPMDIVLQPLSTDINTSASEYLSQFTIDDQELIFIRRIRGQEDLYTATRAGEGFHVTPIEEINTYESEGAHTISADGRTLIFTHCSEKFGYGSCDLYMSTKQPDSTWSKPSNLGRRINTKDWESQPSLSPDGQLLFFVSTQPMGNHGGSDIWYSRRQDDGTWSTPTNAGDIINTKKRDETPFFHPDGQTLYFRSDGHPNLGGFDLFMSRRGPDGWGEVTNLGSPINTNGSEGGLIVSLNGLKGYYATDNYQGEMQDHLDIFQFDMPEEIRPMPMTYVKGRVLNNEGLPLIADVSIQYLEGLPIKTGYKTNYNGEFLAAVPTGTPTLLNISSDGYLFYSDHVDYKESRYGVDPYLLDITLTAVIPVTATEDKPIILRNIFFESGSAQLIDISLSEIRYLRDLINENKTISIKIIGHTDNVGDDNDNLRLSQARAEAVKEALVQMDIASSRIETQGAGESLPIASNDTEEGRSINRRTEFVIIR